MAVASMNHAIPISSLGPSDFDERNCSVFLHKSVYLVNRNVTSDEDRPRSLSLPHFQVLRSANQIGSPFLVA